MRTSVTDGARTSSTDAFSDETTALRSFAITAPRRGAGSELPHSSVAS